MTDLYTNNISALNVGGNGYHIKDTEARNAVTAAENRISQNETDISTLKAAVKGGTHFIGKIDAEKTTLDDGAHTNPVYIVGNEAAVVPAAGDFCIVASGSVTREFIWDGIASGEEYAGTWREMGSTGALKAMAFVDAGTFTDTPEGGVTVVQQTAETDTVTDPTFTGTAKKPTGTFNGTEATIQSDYTPAGEVSAPGITVTPTTTDVSVVTLTPPSAPAEGVPSDETLTISVASSTVVKSATAALDNAPTFTGTAGKATATYTPAGGLAMDDYTPEGANSGTAVTLKPHTHNASFQGTEHTVTVTPKNS